MSARAQSTYRSKGDSLKNEAERIRKRINMYSVIRLILFALVVFLCIRWLRPNPVFAALSSLTAFSLLILFVRLSAGLSARKRMLAELIRINEEETGALEWKYDTFHPGTEYMDPEHPNTSDLDIFGKNSLFQYLERTGISRGRDQLAAWLSKASQADDITRRQEATGELCGELDWRQEFLATGRMSEESREDYIQLSDWLSRESFMAANSLYKSILIILPSLTLASLALAFFWLPYNIPVFLVLIQLGIVGANLRRINHHHNQLSRKFNLIMKFSSLIRMIEEKDFNAPYLKDLQAGLSSGGLKAGKQLHALGRLLVQFDRRLNMIMGFVLNGFLMWDLQCIMRLERWKTLNSLEVPRWFSILGEFDALNSFANFRFNIQDAVFPEISSGDTIIQAESLGHPLIPGKENIRNDLSISKPGEFMLITGSNMAGKSTFLRTIGVNMVLAGAGAPVLASRMIWKPVRILTSMRVRDSLSSRESTFYAELKRLRMIIEELKTGEQVLVILDEILKGTNSRDKHFGSDMFIRQLVREDCMGLIATHDLELSRLEKEFPENILNYSFEVQINNQEFIYDYKLRRGVCQTLNATELMKQMGISIDLKS